uniref:endonuclease domain-containing protein n=1 Tax=Dokdonella sp. TaxID=2291710 RepID=UPI002620CE04
SRIENARNLRRNSTDAENRLWYYLRDRRLGGFRFRRQVPLGRYVADFVCMRERLIVELDGGQHMDHRADDEERSRYLERAGFRVLRFWNDDVLLRTEAVLESLLAALCSACPHPNPLPQAGEGERKRALPQAGEGERE